MANGQLLLLALICVPAALRPATLRFLAYIYSERAKLFTGLAICNPICKNPHFVFQEIPILNIQDAVTT